MLTYYGYEANNIRIVILGKTLLDHYNAVKNSRSKSYSDPVFVYVEKIYLEYYRTEGDFPKAKHLYEILGRLAMNDGALQFIIKGKDSDGNYELNNDKKLKFSNFENWCTKIKKRLMAERYS